MADQEVIKHTKKVYSIWNSKTHSFWQKLKEFTIEIIIIVFAVTLSIWLHDRSEHRHQQKEVKEFLLGLRQDLRSDIKEMNEDVNSYQLQTATFRYITSVRPGDTLSTDSLKKYSPSLFNTTRLQQNNGRFEGFKASGKIGNIEDKTLQNDILDLYQENIPSLLASSDIYIALKTQLFNYGIKNRKKNYDFTTNMSAILLADEAQNLCGYLGNTNEILQRYDICIKKMQSIVKQIEDKYDVGDKD